MGVREMGVKGRGGLREMGVKGRGGLRETGVKGRGGSVPLVQLIQADVLRSSDAGFLLPPLPVRQLPLHQEPLQLRTPVQEPGETRQHGLSRTRGAAGTGEDGSHESWTRRVDVCVRPKRDQGTQDGNTFLHSFSLFRRVWMCVC